MLLPKTLWPGLASLLVACLAISSPAMILAQKPAPPETAELATLSAADIESAAESGDSCVLRLLGEDVTVRLEATGIRAGRFKAVDSSGKTLTIPSRAFKGAIVGDPTSMVRLSVCGEHVRGFIKNDEGWTFIEPARDLAGIEHRVYTEVEIDEDFTGGCDVILAPGMTTSRSTTANHDHPPVASAEGDMHELEVAVVADYEFYETHGEDSLAEIESIMNDVDGIYEAELGLSIEIVSATIWDAETDPFESDDATDLLYELKDQWVADNGAVDRDIVHLFTGRNLLGSTIGIAFLSVVCSDSFGYGLSQDIGSAALQPLVVAHEIGHNLGSPHDETGTEDKYIMYPSLNSATIDEFSDDSEDSIGGFVDDADCLELLEAGGVENPSTDPGLPSVVPSDDGGGPVDPLTLLLLALGAWRLRRGEGNQE